MKLRLIRPYMTRPAGAMLNSVPGPRARRLVEHGIAVLVEDKKGKKNAVANNKPAQR